MALSTVISNDNPLAYWRCEETSGSTLSDNTSNNFDATAKNGFNIDGRPLPSGSSSSFEITGQDGHADFGGALSEEGPLSVEFWFQPTELPSDTRFLWEAGDGGLGVANVLQPDGTVTAIRVDNNDGNKDEIDSTTTLSTGQIYYIVTTWQVSEGDFKLYIDASQENSSSNLGFNDATSANPGSIGFKPGGGSVVDDGSLDNSGTDDSALGYYDEIAGYDEGVDGENAVLTPTQIQEHYDEGLMAVSNATANSTGTTTAAASVNTSKAEGTLYAVITNVETAPSNSQIKNGNNGNGNPAADSASQSINSTGTKSFSFDGLSDGSAYKVYFYQEDSGGNSFGSTSTAGFATDVGSLVDKTTTVYYPYVEWSKAIEESDVDTNNLFDPKVMGIFTPNDDENKTIEIEFYYAGKFNGVPEYRLRFSGLAVDTYSLSTSSMDFNNSGNTDVSQLDGLSASVTVNDQSNIPQALKPLTFDDQIWAARNKDGSLEPRDLKIQHHFEQTDPDANNAATYDPRAKNLESWQGEEGTYASRADDLLSETNADMWFDRNLGHFFNANASGVDPSNWDTQDPDPLSFDVLDNILDEFQSMGYDHSYWSWGDDYLTNGANPDSLDGGPQGAEEERLTRYIAARLGPRVELSMIFRGFDLQIWDNSTDIEWWAAKMKNLDDYDTLVTARGYASESGANPNDPGTDDNPVSGTNGYVAPSLDITEYSTHADDGQDLTDGMSTPFIHGGTTLEDVISYSNIENEVQNRATNEPVLHGERFWPDRVHYNMSQEWTEDRMRQYLWRAHMALHVPAVWGEKTDGSSGNLYSSNDLTMFKTSQQFWDSYLSLGLVVDNSISPDSNSWGVRESDDSRLIVYKENTSSINVDLSSQNGDYKVKSVNTAVSYSENNEGRITSGTTNSVDLSSTSDWVLEITPPPRSRNSMMMF